MADITFPQTVYNSRNTRREKGVYSKLLKREQREYENAASTQTVPPGGNIKPRAESDNYRCLALLKADVRAISSAVVSYLFLTISV